MRECAEAVAEWVVEWEDSAAVTASPARGWADLTEPGMLFGGDMELSGNYLYNGSDSYVEEESSKITYMEDGSRLLNDNTGTSTNASQGHRFGIRLDREFSENTSILFEPQFNFGSGSYSERSDFSTRTARGADTTFTNRGFNDNRGDNNNWSASGRLLFRQRPESREEPFPPTSTTLSATMR